MNRTYHVTTNPSVKYPDIDVFEEVNVDSEAGGMSVSDSGALIFEIDGDGEVVVYAPGVWVQVTGGTVS